MRANHQYNNLIQSTIRCIVWILVLAGLSLYLLSDAEAFDLPPFDTGHNFSGNGGGPGGGGGGPGGGGGDPITIMTGDFVYDTLDWSFRSRGYPLRIVRWYHSDDFYDGPFGFGWHLDILWTLIPIDDPDNPGILIRRGDGRRYFFYDDGQGNYTPEPGYYEALVRQGEGYRLYVGALIYDFNSTGLPTRAELFGLGVDFEYDASGRLLKLTSDSDQVLNFEYGGNRRIRRISDWTGRQTLYEYDDANNLRVFTDQEGHQMRYEYDQRHNLLRRISKRGNAFPVNQYDALRRVTFQSYADGTLTFQYRPENMETLLTNQQNQRITYRYNEAGKPIEIIDPGNNRVLITWDENLNRTSYTDTAGNITRYFYDEVGRLSRVEQPNNVHLTFNYNTSNGLLESVTSNTGLAYSYEYDTLGRVIRAELPGNQISTFSYAGNQITVNSPSGTSQYTLNSMGYITAVRKGANPVENHSYDQAGNLIQTQVGAAQKTYAYTDRDRLASVTEGNSVTQYYYDEENSLSRVVYPDGTEDLFKYDQYNRLMNPLELSGRIVLLNYNPTDSVEQEFLSTLGQALSSQYFHSVWYWGSVLAAIQ